MNRYTLEALADVPPEELGFLKRGTADLTDNQQAVFYRIYLAKRKSTKDVFLYTLVGFLIPGLQRFKTGQIWIGLLYLVTLGLLFMGTIVDLFYSKTLSLRYNQKKAYQSYQVAKMEH